MGCFPHNDPEDGTVNYNEAIDIVDKVMGAQRETMSIYSACKAAGVTCAQYKEARFLVLGPNESV